MMEPHVVKDVWRHFEQYNTIHERGKVNGRTDYSTMLFSFHSNARQTSRKIILCY